MEMKTTYQKLGVLFGKALQTFLAIEFVSLACGLVLFTAGIRDFFEYITWQASESTLVLSAGTILFFELIEYLGNYKLDKLGLFALVLFIVMLLTGSGFVVGDALELLREDGVITSFSQREDNSLPSFQFVTNLTFVVAVSMFSGALKAQSLSIDEEGGEDAF